MVGEFVLSVSGRDKGRVHVIVAVEAEGERVFLCDGKTRRMAKPKPKKLKHVKFLSYSNAELNLAIANGCADDRMIRSAIAQRET